MCHDVLGKIEELFGDPQKFSPENMESLVHETLHFFNQLKMKLESTDEQEKAEAVRLAVSVKTKLEEQALQLCKRAGMDPQGLESYMNNPSHFSQEEWQAMQKAKAELEEYKQELTK